MWHVYFYLPCYKLDLFVSGKHCNHKQLVYATSLVTVNNRHIFLVSHSADVKAGSDFIKFYYNPTPDLGAALPELLATKMNKERQILLSTLHGRCLKDYRDYMVRMCAAFCFYVHFCSFFDDFHQGAILRRAEEFGVAFGQRGENPTTQGPCLLWGASGKWLFSKR